MNKQREVWFEGMSPLAVVVVALIGALVLDHVLGVGCEQGVQSPPAVPPVDSPSSIVERTATDAQFLLPSEAAQPTAADTRCTEPAASDGVLSPAEPATMTGSVFDAGGGIVLQGSGANILVGQALPRDLAPGFLPTAEGLYSLTVEMWSQEGFLELTADEMRALIPLDDSLAVTAPGSLPELLGGLPTMEDCERALEYPDVVILLSTVQLYEATLARLWERPHAAKTEKALQRERDSAVRALMHRLDEPGVSGYRNWSLLWRLFQEWESD